MVFGRRGSGCCSGSGCEVGGLASLVGRMVWGWLGHSGVKANLDKLMFTADERNEIQARRTGAGCRQRFATHLQLLLLGDGSRRDAMQQSRVDYLCSARGNGDRS